MIELMSAEPRHAKGIIDTLRDHDRMEFELFGEDPVIAIERAIRESSTAWTAELNGQVVCIWGVKFQSIMTGGHLWLVTTSLIEKYPKKFLVESRRVVREALDQYFFLYGFVEGDFVKSQKWMEWLGFENTSVAYLGQLKVLRYEQHYGN